jgi:hypothetical protein
VTAAAEGTLSTTSSLKNMLSMAPRLSNLIHQINIVPFEAGSQVFQRHDVLHDPMDNMDFAVGALICHHHQLRRARDRPSNQSEAWFLASIAYWAQPTLSGMGAGLHRSWHNGRA